MGPILGFFLECDNCNVAIDEWVQNILHLKFYDTMEPIEPMLTMLLIGSMESIECMLTTPLYICDMTTRVSECVCWSN